MGWVNDGVGYAAPAAGPPVSFHTDGLVCVFSASKAIRDEASKGSTIIGN